MLDRRACLRYLAGAVPGMRLLAGDLFPSTVADRVDRRYKTPGPRPAGLKATRDGLWILDQATASAYLVHFATGEVKIEIATGTIKPTAIETDEVGLWIAAEDGRKMIRLDFVVDDEGNVKKDQVVRKAEFDVPGAGRVKWRQAAGPPDPIGAQGLAWRRGELYVAVPPAAAIQVLKQDGSTLRTLPAPGICPQGLAWDPDGRLWCADAFSRSFFKLDPATGKIIKQHFLPFATPEVEGKVIIPHGLTIWQRMIYFCSLETGELYRTPLVNRME